MRNTLQARVKVDKAQICQHLVLNVVSLKVQSNSFNNGHPQRRPLEHIMLSIRQHVQNNMMSSVLGAFGLLAGIIILIGNEARAARISAALEESISLVTSVPGDGQVDPSNVGKLIYITGVMTVHEPLTEPEYGISVMAVKLLRQVQMYQWVETESEVLNSEGDVMTKNYYYHTEWQSKLIDSIHFETPMGHWNPKEFPVKRQTQINKNVRIGEYHLGVELKKKFTKFVEVTGDERPERRDIKLHSGIYYHCQDLFKPEVGDVRIQFLYAGHHGEVVTVVARLEPGYTLTPYMTKSGVSILMLRLGFYSVEDMFALEHAPNKFFTWLLRVGGWFLLYVACVNLSTVLQIIISHSRFLQDVLPLSHASLKMTVSMCISLLSTALAWVWYRPVLGVGLVFVSIFLLIFTKWFSNNQTPRSHYNRL